MLPVVTLGLGALLGLMADRLWRTFEGKKQQAALMADPTSFATNDLKRGGSYMVEFVLDPNAATWDKHLTLDAASQAIQGTFESSGPTGGWRFLSPALPQDATSAANYGRGQMSTWLFSARWTRDEAFVKQNPGWVANALAFPLPIS